MGVRLQEGLRIPKRIQLRGGAALRIEITRTVDGMLLRVMAMVPVGSNRVEHQIARRQCEREEDVWLALAEMAQSRLCDLADMAEIEEATE